MLISAVNGVLSYLGSIGNQALVSLGNLGNDLTVLVQKIAGA